jgi:hypothetical protein
LEKENNHPLQLCFKPKLYICLEAERARVDFLIANAAAHKITATTATTTKMRPKLLSPSAVGWDVIGDTDRTETVLLPLLVTNISFLATS